jgi:Carbohydrate esterase, sialic acid-specific acetylesterase
MAGVASCSGEPSPCHPSQLFMWNCQGQCWEPAKDPLFPGCGVGPGLWFADTLAGLQPGRQIGVVPVARNGSSMAEWMPSMTQEEWYGYAISQAFAAVRACNGQIKGVLWYQGEAETMQWINVKLYSPRMHTLFSSFRQDFGNPFLPIVFTQLGPNPNNPSYAYWGAIQIWQQAIANATWPNISMVTAKDLQPIPGNPYHLDATSQITLGGRMAQAMYQLLCGH